MLTRSDIELELASRRQEIRAELLRRGVFKPSTRVGFVHPEQGHTHTLQRQGDGWEKVEGDGDIWLPAKLERVLTSQKRFIAIIGGRGSAKSVGVTDICMLDARDLGAKTYFLREYQSSIKQSVFNLIKDEVNRLKFSEFQVNKTSIELNDEEIFSFSGIARNTDTIKSTHGFKRFAVEEAQFLTQESLDALTPSLRNKPNAGLPKKFTEAEAEIIEDPGVSLLFIANPGSSEDPFSKRFIVPFEKELLTQGYYEDDLHLIVVMNYTDNPWFEESGLEIERAWDYEHRSRAMYRHIWLGDMNDSVENGLIMSEWFDACIDAHIKLGWEPRGAKIASHDPSDTGPDSKGYAFRHGNVFLDFQEKDTGTVNEGAHWACRLAIEAGADYYTWDGDGMGAALAEQTSKDFEGKHTDLVMFKGSEEPDNPNDIYSPALKAPVEGQKTLADTFANKRAQYYFDMRDRCYRTYRAVVLGEYHDPETLISFSADIALLPKVRSELCRIPVKELGSGLLGLYTKQEMKAKFKISSPNLGDSAVMNLRYSPPQQETVTLNFKRRRWK